MRTHRIDTQDGTRPVYVLAQVGKIIEMADLEWRLAALEDMTSGKSRIPH